MIRQMAIATVQIDNHFVRVTKWDFPPGTETGSHTHEYDYVVVPLTTGRLTIQTAEGDFSNELVVGVSYHGSAKTSHNVVNESDSDCSFVEVEVKNPVHL